MTETDPKLTEIASRLDELESKVMFQQDTIDSLNEIITEQWKFIDRLKLQITKLDDQLYELEMASSGASANPKPPHY